MSTGFRVGASTIMWTTRRTRNMMDAVNSLNSFFTDATHETAVAPEGTAGVLFIFVVEELTTTHFKVRRDRYGWLNATIPIELDDVANHSHRQVLTHLAAVILTAIEAEPRLKRLLGPVWLESFRKRVEPLGTVE